MPGTVVIVDYGSGNLRSAAKSFERVINDEGLNMQVIVTGNPKDAQKASRIVLPGQGAFGSCMDGLKATNGMLDIITDKVLTEGCPFLGICVGMQLLADNGLEHGDHKGLGWIGGTVVKMTPSDPSLKIPHMGWSPLVFNDENRHPILKSTKENDHFYFVHSYMFELADRKHSVARVEYGGEVTAIAGRDNIAGVQFHPEKSQKAGLNMIKDFLLWNP